MEGRCEDNGRRSVLGEWEKVGVRIMEEGRFKENGRSV